MLLASYEVDDLAYISSPLRTDDRYRISYIAKQAATLAGQFDPELKPKVAEMILQMHYEHIGKRAEQGQGYIISSPDYDGGVSNDQVNLPWTAIEFDATAAREWAPKYEALIAKFVSSGRPSSAMYTANLVGDLASGAQGEQDFIQSTRASEGGGCQRKMPSAAPPGSHCDLSLFIHRGSQYCLATAGPELRGSVEDLAEPRREPKPVHGEGRHAGKTSHHAKPSWTRLSNRMSGIACQTGCAWRCECCRCSA